LSFSQNIYSTISPHLETTRRRKNEKKTTWQHVPQQRILSNMFLEENKPSPWARLPHAPSNPCRVLLDPGLPIFLHHLANPSKRQWINHGRSRDTALAALAKCFGDGQQHQFIGKVLDAISMVHDF